MNSSLEINYSLAMNERSITYCLKFSKECTNLARNCCCRWWTRKAEVRWNWHENNNSNKLCIIWSSAIQRSVVVISEDRSDRAFIEFCIKIDKWVEFMLMSK